MVVNKNKLFTACYLVGYHYLLLMTGYRVSVMAGTLSIPISANFLAEPCRSRIIRLITEVAIISSKLILTKTD